MVVVADTTDVLVHQMLLNRFDSLAIPNATSHTANAAKMTANVCSIMTLRFKVIFKALGVTSQGGD